VDDQANNVGAAWTLSGSAVVRIRTTPTQRFVTQVYFGDFNSVAINAGGGSDTFTMANPATSPIAFDGGGGSDKLVGPNATNTWSITGANGGAAGSFRFSAVENLTGGSGVDEFVFSPGASVSGRLDGGGAGNDWLDYAAYTTLVPVSLTSNTATGVTGGIANIRNVRGGQGGNILTGNSLGNILIGGNGTDTIIGGSGRSILIGGKGNEIVKGGSDDDIAIGGYTDFDSTGDAHDQALMSILAEWQSANSYATRISHILSGGGLNGSNKLVFGTTVHDDGNSSTLTGNTGSDWFFKGAHDTITDKATGERVN
jgi:hypothetical protein